MYSKVSKRMIAMMLAAVMCLSTLFTGSITAKASEFSESNIEEISENVKNETSLRTDDEQAVYRFVPQKTGVYHFYSAESGDTYGVIYDESGNKLKEAFDDGESGVDFSIEQELTAGATYYLGVDYYLDTDEGTIIWYVEYLEEHGAENPVSEDDPVASPEDEVNVEETGESVMTMESGEGTDDESSELEWYYYLNDEENGLVITGNNDYEASELIIPEILSYEGKEYPVTQIDSYAFSWREYLTEITIPDTVTTICEQAFSGTSITEVFLPESVTEIGWGAFYPADPGNSCVYLYGKAGSVSEDYCNWMCDSAVVFRNVDGVYLTKLPYDETIEMRDKTMELSVEWPRDDMSELTWSSSDDTIVSVDQNGIVTWKKKGTAEITVFRGDYSDFVTIQTGDLVETSQDGRWKYSKLSETTAALCGYTGGDESRVTMPDNVDGYTVTRLNRFYMNNWDGVKEIVLPTTVRLVESYALRDCNSAIVIPENNTLEMIGDCGLGWNQVYGPKDFAFKGCAGSFNLDKALYIGIESEEIGEEEESIVSVVAKHVPSDVFGSESIQWSVSDSEIANIISENDQEIVVRGTGMKAGTVTITAEIGTKYSASIEYTFDEKGIRSEDGCYVYHILEDGSVAIDNYTGMYEGCIEIPAILDGYNVSRINKFAFAGSAAYVIPDSITTIQDQAFGNDFEKSQLVSNSDVVKHYAKRNSDSVTVCSPDQIVLSKNTLSLFVNREIDDEWYGDSLDVRYIPKECSSEEIVWTSSDPEVAAVDEDGLVRAMDQGTAQITATIGSFSTSCQVEVVLRDGIGDCYIELEDGTVELLSVGEYGIPSQINGKDISVIGSLEYNGFFGYYEMIELPDTVHTIRANAFLYESYDSPKRIDVPDSVTTIEEDAFAGGCSYILYGKKGSAAEKYAQAHDNIEFKERSILLVQEEMYLTVGESAELSIGYYPKGVNIEDPIRWPIRWESSDESVVRLETNESNDFVTCIPVKMGEAVITCSIGEYEASANVIVWSDGSEAETQTFGDFSYRVNKDGTIRIFGYSGEETKVTVPEEIDGKEVVSVKGFGWNTNVEEVILPTTVTEIAYNAFANCLSLKSVNLSELSNLECIGDCAFAYTPITEAMLPDSVTELGNSAFRGCAKLSNVKLGTGIEGLRFGTFMGCTSLKNITLPTSLTYISFSAFRESGLTSIDIPDSVTSIGGYAFLNCESLSSINVGNKIAFIGEEAFKNCNVSTLELGGEKLEISSFAYSNNLALTSLTLKEGVTTLQYRAFYDCENLENISFPSSLKKIAWASFENTKWMDNQKEGPVYINDILYTYKGTIEKDKTVVVQSGTKYIEEHAFDGQQNMTNITLPSTLKAIREYAFYNCDSLDKITIPSSVEKIEERALGYYTPWKKNLNLVICGVEGSAAESYAKKNGFEFEVLEVEPIPMTGITLSDTNISLKEKQKRTLTVSYEPADTTDSKEVSWSSSNEKIATVDKDGNITAVGEGTATITAAVGKFEKECNVTVTHDFGPWETIKEPSKEEDGIEHRTCAGCGKTEERVLPKITGTWKKDTTGWWYQYDDGSYAQNEVVKIDNTLYAFNEKGYVVNGWFKDAEGAYYYSTSNGLKTGWCLIDSKWYYMDPVTGKRIIDLQSTKLSLKEKETYQLINAVIEINDDLVSWESQDKSIATIDKTGKVTAVSEGTTSIIVKVGDAMQLCGVEVSHDFGNWITKKPASTAETGLEERICSGCGKIENRELPKISGKWKNDGIGWWYRYDNGSYPKNEVLEIEGILYAFNASGYIANGWYKDAEGVYYYSTSNGLKTGWQMIGEIWYYMDPETGKLLVELQSTSVSLKEEESKTIAKIYIEDDGIEWSSSDPGVADIDGSGKVIAKAEGSATISVTAGSISKECKTTVSHNFGSWEIVTPATKEETGLQKRTCEACGHEEENEIPKITGTWKKNATGWWYSYSDGTYAKSEIVKIDGVLYAFNASGYIVNGWYKDSEGEYYYSTTSGLKSGWLKISGKWYYLDPEDYKAYKEEWLDDTYYFLSNNAMATGWQLIGDDWYYFNSAGAKVVNKWVDGVYYLKEDGKMAVDEWIGDYYVDASGKWVPGKEKID